jgi:DNA-binding MarR family transcriptional regulator
MDFFDKTGKMAIGSRLRRLSESLTNQAADVYKLYEVDMQPKWFPVFFSLVQGEGKFITEIAEEIGQSHPSVSTIVKEMVKKGYVAEQKISDDGRKNFIVLTEMGNAVYEKAKVQYQDVGAAVEKLLGETQYNLWKAIEEWEYHLNQKNLLHRVKDERKIRESSLVKIIDYLPEYQYAFRELNVAWITQYFKMEAADYQSLDHPGNIF